MKLKKPSTPKLTWRNREDGGKAAYYGIPGNEILLVVYQQGGGHWWGVTLDFKIRDECDAYFIKMCESQWGMEDLKRHVQRVLSYKFEELKKDQRWFKYVDQWSSNDQAKDK